MKKRAIIEKANLDRNPIWELVHILEDDGKVEKTKSIRKPAVRISETQVLVNLSNTETLIIKREEEYGPITNYRLIKYDLVSGKIDGEYK